MITLTRQELIWLKRDTARRLNEFQSISEDVSAPPVEREIAETMRCGYNTLYGKLLDICMDGAKRIAVK